MEVKQQGRPSSANRPIAIVLASGEPKVKFDDYQGEYYDEYLSLNGIEFRTAKRQIPIVDSADSSTIRNVLGSVRNIRVEQGQLVGDAYFASDASSQAICRKFIDGHLSEFSVTASPREVHTVKAGQSVKFRGKTVKGPAEIVTRWVPVNAALVASG